MKTCYVASLQDGERVDDIFLVSSKNLGKTQDGSPYVRLRLCDRTGAIDAIKWDANEASYAGLAVDDFVHVRGTVGTYRNRLQLSLDFFRKFVEKIDPNDFLPRCERDVEEMYSCLRRIIESIKNDGLSRVLSFFFDDEDFVDRFKTAPAAQKIHHAYIGGLLEHTLSVAQNCDLIASHYPQLNRDLLLTGAILHDIGKIDELCWSRSIRYSDTGHLIGHVVHGCSMVETAAETATDMNPLLKLELMHLILSHHGEKEWGSPKRPKSLQAIVLHYMDDLDAKVDMLIKATNAENNDSKTVWTERHWVLDRPLLRGHVNNSVLEDRTSGSDGGNGADEELNF